MKSLHICKYAALTFLGIQLMIGCSTTTDPGPNGKPPKPEPPIVFVSNRDGNHEIYKMSSLGSNNPDRLTNAAGNDVYPHWSPDREKIVFNSNTFLNVNINLNRDYCFRRLAF